MSKYKFSKNGEAYEIELSEEEEREILAQKSSITFYSDRLVNYTELTDQELGAAVRAVFNYALKGEPLPPDLGRIEKMYATTAIGGFVHSNKDYVRKCLINRENGKKGGRPSKRKGKTEKTQSVSEETQENPEKPHTQTQTQTDTETGTRTITGRVTESTSRAPSLSEVTDLFRKESLKGSPESFFHWWEGNNWERNGKPVNWESEARLWSSREKEVQAKGNGSGAAPNKFHNFHQRDYDYESLEKDLLKQQW